MGGLIFLIKCGGICGRLYKVMRNNLRLGMWIINLVRKFDEFIFIEV